MLRNLTRMPADLSSDSRRQLLHAVTDLFLLDHEPNEAAKEHYGEIATNSLSHLGDDDRKGYADRVATLPTLPHNLAVTLGGDGNAEVARLVLSLSPVLTDTDLAAIAVSQSQQHLVAIAERARLSESVTDILVERGDQRVLHTVSANEGAAFSDRGFDRLLERGEGDAAITGALARRSDLAPNRAQRVLRIVEQFSDGGGSAPATEASTSLARQARQQRLEVKLLLSDLAAKVRALTGQDEQQYSVRQAAYDLRKLRGKHLVVKPDRSRRYQVPGPAARTLAALLTLRDRVIAPILAGVRRPGPRRPPTTYTRVDRDYDTLCKDMRKLFNDLAIEAAA